jgi:hypothetical protein
MKAVALIVTLSLLQSAAFAAGPKPKICFTPAEQNAEQLVRGGLRLREGALGCDGPPWNFGTKPAWEQVDRLFGPRFKQQTDIRRKAFDREFSKDAENNERAWDGRTVLFFRNYPLSVPYCTEIKNSLDTLLKKGWNAFVAKARLYRDQVEDDYRPCS